MTNRPDKPLASYPDAELPPLPAGAPAGEEPTGPARARSAAVLRFLDPGAQRSEMPLQHPFAWEGREVRAITIRRLNVAEVGSVMLLYGEDDPIDVWDFIAAMTDLPPEVLRGLAGDDGAEVLAAARPLLPRFVQPLLALGAEATA